DQKRADDHGQVGDELTQYVVVNNQRKIHAEKTPTPVDALKRAALSGAGHGLPFHGKPLLQIQPEIPHGTDFHGHPVHAPEQEQTSGKEERIRKPYAYDGRQLALPRKRHSEQGNEVISKHQHDSENYAGGLTAL